MLKRFERQTMIFIPLAGANVMLGDFFRGKALPQALAQQFSKEMVIAIPLPLVVERDDEQVGAFEIFQRRLPGTCRGEQHGLAQRTAQAIEDARCAARRSGCLRLAGAELLPPDNRARNDDCR